MAGDELGVRYAVAVGEDQVVGARLCDGTIQDAAFAEAIVLVPDVPDVELPLVARAFDAPAGVLGRAVVRDHDLEAPEGLARVPREHALEIMRTVVGGGYAGGGG